AAAADAAAADADAGRRTPDAGRRTPDAGHEIEQAKTCNPVACGHAAAHRNHAICGPVWLR
ncbi:hypothetical protein, partial [Cognatiluteimonas telluris]|uniref:hypothetical protein n=1 Tax=Cognatiluteimonas telluris TaxID=1104775 RepID=UPI001A9C9F1B